MLRRGSAPEADSFAWTRGRIASASPFATPQAPSRWGAPATVGLLLAALLMPAAAIAQEPGTGCVVLNSYSQPPFVQAGEAAESGLAPTFVRLLRDASRLPVPLTLEDRAAQAPGVEARRPAVSGTRRVSRARVPVRGNR